LSRVDNGSGGGGSVDETIATWGWTSSENESLKRPLGYALEQKNYARPSKKELGIDRFENIQLSMLDWRRLRILVQKSI
jgi:hypothetical protein